MTDLLAHVLVAYVTFTVASWRLASLTRAHVPLGVVGAVLPDLAKVRLVLPGEAVESVLDVPFSWLALHRLGGVLALAGVGALTLPKGYRRRAYGLLVAGAGTHLLLDAGIQRANHVAPPFLYPFSWWQPPAGMLYLSSDLPPTVVAILLAALVWVFDRRRAADA